MNQEECEQKKRECWESVKFVLRASYTSIKVFHLIFDRAYALGKQEKDEVKATESGRFELKYYIPDPAKMMDGIIKDSFREHNRLQIASMAMQGILANRKLTEWRDIDQETYPRIIKASLLYADALMKAAGKGGGE